MTKHTRIIEHLKILAEDIPPVSASRISAALVRRNEIISYGSCSYKSHPLQKRFGKAPEAIFLHAEMDAIKNAIKRYRDTDILKECTLYVARVKRPEPNSKEFISGLACPCEGCSKAIATFGIKHVCYTLDDDGYHYM